jgi:YidC/Oxa1 family membrane protein insertase
MDRRVVLATVLMLAVWMGYFEYVRRTAPPRPPRPTSAPVAPAPVAPAPEAPPSAQPAATPPPSAVAPSIVPPAPSRPEKTYTWESKLYRAVFTDRGGGVKSLQLLQYAQTLTEGSPRVELVRVGERAGGAEPRWPLGLRLYGATTLDLENLSYEGRQEGNTLLFSAALAEGLRITKRYTFDPTSYLFSLEVEVHNETGGPLPLGIGLLWRRAADEGKRTSRFTGHAGPVTLVGTKVEREKVKDLKSERILEGRLLWTGFETKYFLAALIPSAGQQERARARIWKTKNGIVASELFFPPTDVPAGAPISQTFGIYAGPKGIDQLETAGAGLEKAVSFGMFAFLARPLVWVLNFFETFVQNYGVAIILLTILIRIAFFPLATKQFRSMKEMQRLQPLLKELREKYKNDKERLNQETMQLFRTHKVNPLGGCLPMVLQIPVFIALYEALLNSISLRQAAFVFWIRDLSAPDPTYISPVLMTGSMFLQQKMSPPAADPAQQKIMMFMPLVFGVMFLNFPSGLVIYWLANNLLAIAQQYWINRRYG